MLLTIHVYISLGIINSIYLLLFQFCGYFYCLKLYLYFLLYFSYFWGWLSDKKGRRPIILLCVSLIGLTTLSFGFTTNIYFAVITRMLSGLVNGKWILWLEHAAGSQEIHDNQLSIIYIERLTECQVSDLGAMHVCCNCVKIQFCRHNTWTTVPLMKEIKDFLNLLQVHTRVNDS